jgi:signal transduction histidine kinase
VLFRSILRHSGASRVRVSLSARNGRIALEVEDNGVGLSHEESATAGTGFGLINIRQRVVNMKGMVSFHSAEGGGTKVSLIVPLEEGCEDDQNFSG